MFNTICLILTIFLVTKCFQTYWKNEDVCLVSFKRFNDDSDQVYPTITICTINPFETKKLTKILNGDYNTSYVIRAMQGYIIDENLSNTKYDDVTVDLNEYLLNYNILFPHQPAIPYDKMSSIGQNGWTGPYVSFRKEEVKCFSFDIPFNKQANIHGVAITLNSSLFENETRPFEWPLDPNNRGIAFALHMKSQMLLSYSTMRYIWQKRSQDDPKHYSMEFSVNTLDIVTYRSKKNEPCVKDWKDYDRILYDDLMNQVGCQVEYWKLNKSLPYCNRPEQFEKIDRYFNQVLTNIITPPPPCRTIKQAQYDYKDVEDSSSSGVTFVVDFKNLNHHYKEISQVEAYTVESLIGKIRY